MVALCGDKRWLLPFFFFPVQKHKSLFFLLFSLFVCSSSPLVFFFFPTILSFSFVVRLLLSLFFLFSSFPSLSFFLFFLSYLVPCSSSTFSLFFTSQIPSKFLLLSSSLSVVVGYGCGSCQFFGFWERERDKCRGTNFFFPYLYTSRGRRWQTVSSKQQCLLPFSSE
jgi:hypothetical protein